MSEQKIERISYTVEQASEATGLSKAVLHEAIRGGTLPCFQSPIVKKSNGVTRKTRTRRHILAEDLNNWLRGGAL